MNMDIYISEKSGKREMRIPWLPEKIKFKSNGTRFASYEVLDLGEVKVPGGTNLRGFEWEGTLPGEGSRRSPLLRGEWLEPRLYQEIWSVWRANGTPLRLIVTGTPINHDVYLDDYDVTYSGAFGDYSYSIAFTDARSLSISVLEKTAEEPQRTETQSETESYTVKDGDTLWDIAGQYLGECSRWPELYELNSDIIESTARQYGKASSSNGHWIYPGTVLKIRE